MENEMTFDLGEDWFRNQDLLQRVIKKYLPGGQPLRFLEIGSWKGRSAIWFLENFLSHPQSLLYCVDTWDMNAWNDFNQEKQDLLSNPHRAGELKINRLYEQFLFNIRFKGFSEKCKPIRDKSVKALQLVEDNSFDFIYVDGDHSVQGCYEDLAASWPKLKKGGILFGDDWTWGGEDGFPVKVAARKFAKERNLSIRPLIKRSNGFYFVKK